MNPDDSDSLDKLLKQWVVNNHVDSDFRREVWQRIATDSRQSPWMERLAWWLLRPKREAFVLASVVAAAVLWGLTHPPQSEMSPHDAYVMSVSPFDPHHIEGIHP
jgi:hypothetical protein